MMKKIKIQFADVYQGYNRESNNFVKRLRKKYDVEISDTPDILFYFTFGTGVEHLKYKNCIKVFISYECVYPNYNDCDYAIGMMPINFKDRYLRITNHMNATSTMMDRKQFCDEKLLSRKFCNFIYSNDSNGEGAVFRKQFCEQLMKYKHIDCPGRVLNNMHDDRLSMRTSSDWQKSKINYLSEYKFTIAIENSFAEGYFTEKITDPFEAGSVPIYCGDRLIGETFNEESFIHIDRSAVDDAIDQIIYYDTHDDEYLELLKRNPVVRPEFFDDTEQMICDFLYNIVENGTVCVEGDSYIQDKPLRLTSKFPWMFSKSIIRLWDRK